MTEPWRLRGEYFESCNCEVLCPCLLSRATARPTEGHCDAIVAVRIDDGRYGDVDLSGLHAVIAVFTPGAMADGNWTVAPYVDVRGSAAQRAALEWIVTGQAGGPLGRLAPLMATRLPARAVPIAVAVAGRRRSLSIPEVTDVTVEGIVGAGDEVVWLDNVGHFASRRLAAARGGLSRLTDHTLNFDNSGRNGHYASIEWRGP